MKKKFIQIRFPLQHHALLLYTSKGSFENLLSDVKTFK